MNEVSSSLDLNPEINREMQKTWTFYSELPIPNSTHDIKKTFFGISISFVFQK